MIKKVKIGIKDYSVEIDNALSGRGSNGSIDLNSRSIKILPNEIKDEMSIVLFHELWHGVSQMPVDVGMMITVWMKSWSIF